MFYRILHLVMRIAFRLYFGKVKTTGLAPLEVKRPTLILANHTNSFMDAMLLAVLLQRRIHFFARGDAFKRRWADRLLRSLGLMPVYRLQEGKELLEKNDNTNEEAIRILQDDGAVLIFAEGTSNLAKVLKPLKKGPFRLAVHAREAIGKPLFLAPLGINFLRPEASQTLAWLVAGEVVESTLPAEESEASVNRAALVMMRQTAAALQQLVPDAHTVPKSALLQTLLEIARADANGHLDFARVKSISDAFNAAADDEGLLSDITSYQVAISAAGLEEIAFSPGSIGMQMPGLLLAAVAGVPGWLFHFLPLAAARLITRHTVREPDFIAAVYCCLAVITVTFWYLTALLLTGIFAGWGVAVVALPVTVFCGIVAFKIFLPLLNTVTVKIRLAHFLRRRPALAKTIQPLRSRLQQWLNRA